MINALFMLSLSVLIVLSDRSLHAAPTTNPSSKQEQAPTVLQEANSVVFTPPKGWKLAEENSLLPSVRIMVVGTGTHEYPPSINLGTESYPGTIKQYLKRIKEINSSQGAVWKDLGKIQTEAGQASLSQVDKKTEWGDVRMMHVILNKDGMMYIITAAALKEEFSKFYKDFFTSFRSLRFAQNEGRKSLEISN